MIKQILIILVSISTFTGCTGRMPELGIKNGQLEECPTTPNCVNSQTKDEKHFIEPILIEAKPPEARNYILKVLRELKQSKIIVVADDYIRAEFISKIFRFVDDVEFYFPDTKSKKLLIHVRSSSRVGYSDLGANRRRIEQIRNKLPGINKE